MREEVYWRQKSREKWLKEGDRNTKFFHNSIKMRRAHNKIFSIENSEGIMVNDPNVIKKEAIAFFKERGRLEEEGAKLKGESWSVFQIVFQRCKT